MRFAGTLALAVLVVSITVAPAQTEGWPRAIDTAKGAVTIYQPQIDSIDGDRLDARAAVSVTSADGGPRFGAVWLTARLETDRDTRLAAILDITVPSVRFPEASEEEQGELARFLEKRVPEWELTIELDRIVADLELEVVPENPVLKHDPPVILHAEVPTVLVVLDGEPLRQAIEGSPGLERVVNTPYLIAFDEGSNTFYLSGGGDLWYAAAEIEGPWAVRPSVPESVARLADVDGAETVDDSSEDPPAILVSTVPAELIVTAGPPSWSPVEGMNLLYVDNTDSSVFMDIESQGYYVLLSGRWYRGHAIAERWEWEYVPNNALPEPFTNIPEDSAVGDVLAHVAGTSQAREAVLDNSIPQTAAVKRSDASLAVEYDGDPIWEKVEDVPGVQYAINTPSSVFKVDDVYFACDQAVWYEASSPTGPWEVATSVPDAIYSLPPSNPHYNVTYVKVYEVTPEVVYVGYTPGYVGSYHSHGCVVWGTGWYYPYWWGRYYYPRSWTWGLHVRYNPWYGWGVGISFGSGPFRITIGRGGWGGWWGPGRYRPYPRPFVRGGYHRTNVNINVNRPGGTRPGGPGGAGRPEQRPDTRANLYNNEGNRDRMAERPDTSDRQRPAPTDRTANDVYTDRSGNIYRRDEGGNWQQRDQGQWRPAEGLDRPSQGGGDRPSGGGSSTRPSTPGYGGGSTTRPSTPGYGGGSTTRPSTPSYGGGSAARPQLESGYQSRQRGSQRSSSYGGGASRGRSGGGRRR